MRWMARCLPHHTLSHVPQSQERRHHRKCRSCASHVDTTTSNIEWNFTSQVVDRQNGETDMMWTALTPLHFGKFAHTNKHCMHILFFTSALHASCFPTHILPQSFEDLIQHPIQHQINLGMFANPYTHTHYVPPHFWWNLLRISPSQIKDSIIYIDLLQPQRTRHHATKTRERWVPRNLLQEPQREASGRLR